MPDDTPRIPAPAAAYLATKDRTRFIAGDNPPPDVRAAVEALVREHRTALGLPVIGYGPITANDINAALEWKEA